jgi:tetratricopeptide (TPR) repeat protein
MEDQEKQIELLERLPENDQTRLLKASILNDLGEYEEAIECCDRTVEQFPYSTRFDEGVQSVKAEALEKLGRHEEAIKCWDKNIKHFEKVFKNDKRLWNKFTTALWRKSDALEKLGRYDESIKLYAKTHEIEKADKNYSDQYGSDHEWWSYVNKLNSLGRHEEALKVCDDVIGYDPTDSAIWEQKVGTLEKLGRHEEAIKCWDKVIEIGVKEEYVATYYYAAKAKILNLLGRHEEAIKCVDEAKTSADIGSPVEKAELFFQKSEALDRLARYEEEIECLDEIIKSFNDTEIVDGRPKDAWKRKARLLRDSGRHEEYKKCREEMKNLFSTAEQKYY